MGSRSIVNDPKPRKGKTLSEEIGDIDLTESEIKSTVKRLTRKKILYLESESIMFKLIQKMPPKKLLNSLLKKYSVVYFL